MQPKATAGSRERMIEAAIDLMRGYGLSGAGVNDIVRNSKAPKGSVYYFFPEGKLQIAIEALTIYSQRVEEFIETALAGQAPQPERVKALFNAFARRAEDSECLRSCPFGAVGLDLGSDDEPLRRVIAASFNSFVAVIARQLDLGSAAKTRSFAGLVLTAIEGAYVRARAERTGQAFREAGSWLAQLAR